MFEFVCLEGNTYCFKSMANVGIYEKGDGSVILIDSCEHVRMVRSVDRYLRDKNLTIDTIISTHCHVDHICGNRFFQEKFGCKILSTETEKAFIAVPDLEPSFYYAGIDTDKTRNPFFMIEPSTAETITEDNTPDGFEIISLPGHSFDMIGVRTPDDIVFLADSIISEQTWQIHRMPFFHNVNESIETLKMLKALKAKWFVPSHDKPMTDISELADYNIERLLDLKERAYRLCEGKSFDEIFKALVEELELKIRTEKYPSYAVMGKNILQSLVEDDRVCAVLEDNIFVWHRK